MEACRVCLKKGILTSIYEKDLNNITLCDKIMECGGVLIRPSMDLPEFICAKCLSNLDVAYNFRLSCKKTDSILQLYLKANNKNNIFLTLSGGKTYKLPEDLKLKIVKVKKETEVEPPPVVNITVPFSSKSPVDLFDEHEEIDAPSNCDQEEKLDNETAIELQPEHVDIAEEGKDFSDDGVEHCDDDPPYDPGNDISNSDNSDKEDPLSKPTVNVVKSKLKVTRLTKTWKKGHIPLKKIINQIKSTSPPKYIRYTSDSDEEQKEKAPPPIPIEKPTRKPDDRPSFICEICGNVYKQNSLLQTHMRRHNNERPFSCEICGKAFVTSSLMARHIKIHTGHKPYKCQFCNRRFYERGTCRAHEKVHSGERPYDCKECGKRFIYSQSLTKHKLIHTGEKLYSCELCGKEFRLFHHLKAHLQTNVHKKETAMS